MDSNELVDPNEVSIVLLSDNWIETVLFNWAKLDAFFELLLVLLLLLFNLFLFFGGGLISSSDDSLELSISFVGLLFFFVCLASLWSSRWSSRWSSSDNSEDEGTTDLSLLLLLLITNLSFAKSSSDVHELFIACFLS